MSDFDDDALRNELAEFATPEKLLRKAPREERVIAGFEEIQRFVEQYGSAPLHGEGRDIVERLYAVRLDRLRALEEYRPLLAPLDHQGLLAEGSGVSVQTFSMSDDDLAIELQDLGRDSTLSQLKHVRSHAEIQAAEEIANREKCEDFERFQPLFEQAKAGLNTGEWTSEPFEKEAEIKLENIQEGDYFIVGGQVAYVAKKGELIRTSVADRLDARLRVVYDNGTQTELLLRSFQRSLYRDDTPRRLRKTTIGPLFGDTPEDGDVESGTIYVLRSRSNHPFVAEHQSLIHKIGVTGGDVRTRLANATHDATYLLAEVDVVATYKLVGINRTRLENLLHRVFAPAQLDLTIQDRFGQLVKPREWFLVPIRVIDEAVKRIRDGSIVGVIYDPQVALLVPIGNQPREVPR